MEQRDSKVILVSWRLKPSRHWITHFFLRYLIVNLWKKKQSTNQTNKPTKHKKSLIDQSKLQSHFVSCNEDYFPSRTWITFAVCLKYDFLSSSSGRQKPIKQPNKQSNKPTKRTNQQTTKIQKSLIFGKEGIHHLEKIHRLARGQWRWSQKMPRRNSSSPLHRIKSRVTTCWNPQGRVYMCIRVGWIWWVCCFLMKGLGCNDGCCLFPPIITSIFFLHLDFHTETRSARVGF